MKKKENNYNIYDFLLTIFILMIIIISFIIGIFVPRDNSLNNKITINESVNKQFTYIRIPHSSDVLATFGNRIILNCRTNQDKYTFELDYNNDTVLIKQSDLCNINQYILN